MQQKHVSFAKALMYSTENNDKCYFSDTEIQVSCMLTNNY